MEPTRVMINGLPGNVCRILIERIGGHADIEAIPYSLTGPEIQESTVTVAGRPFTLLGPEGREAAIAGIKSEFGPFISVDFTHPTAVNANAEFYCAHGLPFVMGTTGGDRARLAETVAASGIPAVIAPNMAKPIVGFQAMLEYAAATFPGLFSGYQLAVRESHQQGKADTSGTAKAVVGAFNRLGIDFDVAAIHKERDPAVQKETWGIPEAYLGGHGWHTYALDSPDGTVHLEFTHNINGRDVYVLGILDAVRFLGRNTGAAGKAFSMIDVLMAPA